jgi:hypothetical protein
MPVEPAWGGGAQTSWADINILEPETESSPDRSTTDEGTPDLAEDWFGGSDCLGDELWAARSDETDSTDGNPTTGGGTPDFSEDCFGGPFLSDEILSDDSEAEPPNSGQQAGAETSRLAALATEKANVKCIAPLTSTRYEMNSDQQGHKSAPPT